MTKRKKVRILRSQAGMTLMEVMVSTGLVGIIFIALMTLLREAGSNTKVGVGQVKTIEGVAETVAILNAVIPQVTRITSCKCRANTSSRAACIWTAADAWYDPVTLGGAASPVVLLAGEFEAYDGTQTLTSMVGLETPTTYGGITCITPANNLNAQNQRGCRQPFQLEYTAPTAATGSASLSGMLELKIGGGTKHIAIGAIDKDGAGGLGLTELSCGFDSSTGGVTGSNFVLNMRVKTKQNTMNTTSHPQYESWYPGDRSTASQSVLATKNYLKGQFREIHLKFNMRNISTRGVYAWRAYSQRNCKANGDTTTKATDCCSQAMSGSLCVSCVAAGSTGTTDSCCSGRETGGTCD